MQRDGNGRRLTVGIFGAGVIGSFVGAHLSAAGLPVVLLGRPWLLETRAELQAVTLAGRVVRPREDLRVVLEPSELADVDVCLVTTKSTSTTSVAESLGGLLRKDAVTLSLQNGLHNHEVLQASIAGPVHGGVVTFNVISEFPGRLVQTTRGRIELGATRETRSRVDAVARALSDQGLQTVVRGDIQRAMAGKLLLNLNNGVCGATGLGIARVLQSAPARWCLAQCLREGIDVMRRRGIRPARVAPLGARGVAAVMGLPDWVFSGVVAKLMTIDARAESSTVQDLKRGRPTEIEQLNGEVVRLAHGGGTRAVCNEIVVGAVREHECAIAAGGTPDWMEPWALQSRFLDALRSAKKTPMTQVNARSHG